MDKTIHNACRDGDIETVRKLVTADPSIVDTDDIHQWRPLFHAGLNRHADIVEFLIESGADLSAHDGYVMHYASEVPNNKKIVGLLVKYGALDTHVRPTDDLSRQFLAAMFLGNETRVRSLLALHPKLATTVDGRGDYPIHHAARNGDTEIIRLLIEHGADVNPQNARGHTVLYCAGGHGHLDSVRLLLKNHADTNAKFTDDGKTLLEWLAQYPDDPRFAKVTKLLVEYEAGR
ncbi:Ankyrin repeats (3 copies) [Planctomycetes bacterium CA13]|uniref:Ankyrin repeats (3 copies) n=1 Tax=Novipirellula herctigrandis TaxID=2527986 RepID=A0A5C5YXG6_9BACT|nr:Ankyrin repeats (3 copies) [Planctomycetes bacterium CA13]